MRQLSRMDHCIRIIFYKLMSQGTVIKSGLFSDHRLHPLHTGRYTREANKITKSITYFIVEITMEPDFNPRSNHGAWKPRWKHRQHRARSGALRLLLSPYSEAPSLAQPTFFVREGRLRQTIDSILEYTIYGQTRKPVDHWLLIRTSNKRLSRKYSQLFKLLALRLTGCLSGWLDKQNTIIASFVISKRK